MKKRNAKLLITATLLILCLALSAVLFAACNGDDLTSAYAEAQKNWSAAKNKVVYDTLVIDGELGSGDSAVPVTVTVEGYRAYIGDEWVFDYNLKATGLEAVAGVLVGSVLEGTGADITLSRSSDGNISLKLGIPYLIDEAVNTSFNESVVRDYLAVFDFADNTFYDVENISGSASSFTIDAESSLGYILYQIAPALSLNFNFDVLPMLDHLAVRRALPARRGRGLPRLQHRQLPRHAHLLLRDQEDKHCGVRGDRPLLRLGGRDLPLGNGGKLCGISPARFGCDIRQRAGGLRRGTLRKLKEQRPRICARALLFLSERDMI